MSDDEEPTGAIALRGSRTWEGRGLTFKLHLNSVLRWQTP